MNGNGMRWPEACPADCASAWCPSHPTELASVLAAAGPDVTRRVVDGVTVAWATADALDILSGRFPEEDWVEVSWYVSWP